MQWYYADNGQSSGPHDDETFANLVTAGTVRDDTLVWHEGMEEWEAYGLQTNDEGARCSVCGRLLPEDDLIRFQDSLICANCKPEFFQRVKEGAPLPGIIHFASLWIRVAAVIIDYVVLQVIWMTIAFVFSFLIAAVFGTDDASPGIAFIAIMVFYFLAIVAVPVLYTFLFLGRFGATPGKMACRIKVVRADGSRITYGRSFARCCAWALSHLTLGIGHLMAAFDEERRTLHDRICDTRVVRSEN